MGALTKLGALTIVVLTNLLSEYTSIVAFCWAKTSCDCLLHRRHEIDSSYDCIDIRSSIYIFCTSCMYHANQYNRMFC